MATVKDRLSRISRQVKNCLQISQLPQGPHDRWLNLDSFRNAAPLLALTVEDNGLGILPDALGKIFDPFFTTKGTGGAGIGLAIVLRLVKQVSGAIQLSSRPGMGTRFTLYLPAWSTRQASPSAPA